MRLLDRALVAVLYLSSFSGSPLPMLLLVALAPNALFTFRFELFWGRVSTVERASVIIELAAAPFKDSRYLNICCLTVRLLE